MADIDYVTTLAGYIQWKMTGERVVGVARHLESFQSIQTNTYFAMIANSDEGSPQIKHIHGSTRCSAARSDRR